MDFTEKTISTKHIFSGHIINVDVDTVKLPNGDISTRELVKHPGGVGIIAIDKNNKVFMVKQFRKPFEKITLEIPAGKLDPGEDPAVSAVRELEEETGYKAKELKSLGSYYSSPGFCDEVIHIYLTTEFEFVGQHLDNDEFLDVVKMDFDELYKMALNGEINDGKTAIAILMANQILN